jgi:hypothetical protein
MCDDVAYNPKTGLTPAEEAVGAVLSETVPPGYEPIIDQGVIVGHKPKYVKWICRTCGNIFDWLEISTAVPICGGRGHQIVRLPDNWIERIFRDDETTT